MYRVYAIMLMAVQNIWESYMKSRIFKIISEVTFWAGIALSSVSAYVLISSSIDLPAGACPVNNGRPYIISAIALLAVSFIASFFTRKNKSKQEDR